MSTAQIWENFKTYFKQSMSQRITHKGNERVLWKKSHTIPIFWDEAKAVVRGKFIAGNTYINKEKCQINNLISCINKQVKE